MLQLLVEVTSAVGGIPDALRGVFQAGVVQQCRPLCVLMGGVRFFRPWGSSAISRRCVRTPSNAFLVSSSTPAILRCSDAPSAFALWRLLRRGKVQRCSLAGEAGLRSLL